MRTGAYRKLAASHGRIQPVLVGRSTDLQRRSQSAAPFQLPRQMQLLRGNDTIHERIGKRNAEALQHEASSVLQCVQEGRLQHQGGTGHPLVSSSQGWDMFQLPCFLQTGISPCYACTWPRSILICTENIDWHDNLGVMLVVPTSRKLANTQWKNTPGSCLGPLSFRFKFLIAPCLNLFTKLPCAVETGQTFETFGFMSF